MPSSTKQKKDNAVHKKDDAPSQPFEQVSLRPNNRATTRSAKKLSVSDTAPTVATQTNSFAALAIDDTDDENYNDVTPATPTLLSMLTAQMGTVKDNIKEGNDRLLLALGSLDTNILNTNQAFREMCENSRQHDRKMEEAIAFSIDKSFKNGFSSFNSTLIEALKIQSYTLQQVVIDNARSNSVQSEQVKLEPEIRADSELHVSPSVNVPSPDNKNETDPIDHSHQVSSKIPTNHISFKCSIWNLDPQ